MRRRVIRVLGIYEPEKGTSEWVRFYRVINYAILEDVLEDPTKYDPEKYVFKRILSKVDVEDPEYTVTWRIGLGNGSWYTMKPDLNYHGNTTSTLEIVFKKWERSRKTSKLWVR